VLRGLSRAGAALALAAFFSAGVAAVLAAARPEEPRPERPRLSDRHQAVAEPAAAARATGEGQSLDSGRPRQVRIRWRTSHPSGVYWAGRLVGGVQLPAGGRTFFTWDPILHRAPNRAWRRWGSDRLVRTLLRVLDTYSKAHPTAPRVGVGDISRPRGGDFGPRYGLPGHVSHQNGLDVDVYYPRLDRRERAPDRPAQIDRTLAQDLVDRFVAAGAIRVFVGPHTGLRGPPNVVQTLAHHDNHLHVRFPLRPRGTPGQ
jgi:murein endopeptidase